MTSHSNFFGERNPQAVLKHGILTRYAHYFAGRAGSATRGRVAFIDAYAGAGRYEDGSPGSPILLASEATRAEVFGRQVKLCFIEPDLQYYNKLQESLKEAKVRPDMLLDTPFDQAIDTLLERYVGYALLIFIDPFGLALNRTKLLQILERSSINQPIDVIYHFSLSSVARIGRAGILDSKSAIQNARRLDETLGIVDWREKFANANKSGESTKAAMSVSTQFSTSVSNESSAISTSIVVRQRPGHLPKYKLILFSKNQKAHWDFADQASMAYVDWLHHCDKKDYERNLQLKATSGLQTLFQEDIPDRSNVEELLESEALEYLKDHVSSIIKEQRCIRLIDHIEDVYSAMLGKARTRHLRQVINLLHTEGLIDDNGQGDFCDREICWIG